MKRLLIVMLCALALISVSACGTKSESDAENAVEKESETTDSTEENSDFSENTEDTVYLSEDIEDTEAVKNPDEFEYITCTVDELVTEIYADTDAAAAKYNGKYMEITGIFDSAEIDTEAGSTVVYMKTAVEPPYQNSAAIVNASSYIWDEKGMTQAEYREVFKTLAEGDEVILRVYVEDYSIYNDADVRWCSLSLIGIYKK